MGDSKGKYDKSRDSAEYHGVVQKAEAAIPIKGQDIPGLISSGKSAQTRRKGNPNQAPPNSDEKGEAGSGK